MEKAARDTSYIYGLCHPITNELRYVGKSQNPDFRLYCHQWDAKRRPTRRLHSWIRSLQKQGLVPEMVIFEECEGEAWVEAERFWIAYFRFVGCNLVNHCDGGEGLWNPSPEVRAKMSAKQKGQTRSAESNARRAEALTGERNPFYGRRHSEATKEKIREKRRASPTCKRNAAWPESQYQKVCKKFIVTTPQGEEIEVLNLPQFCRERGINRGNLASVATGKLRQSQGYKARHA